MWQLTMNDVLPHLLVGAAIAVVVFSISWLWSRRRADRAFNEGGTARNAEFSSLEANLNASMETAASLEQRLREANQNLQRLQAEQLTAQSELARLGEKAERIPDLTTELVAANDNVERLRSELAASRQATKLLQQELENERTQSTEKLTLLTEAKEELSNQFKALAGEILDQKSQKFTEQNQANMQGLISPLKEQLAKFDKQIGDARTEDAKERQQVRSELHQIRDLGLALSANATELTRALKSDTKAQGTWGEMILETVLEKSGLEKGREYVVQESTKTEEGKRIRPDALVHLPENKVIVVDSKVSLTAYERAVNAETEEDRTAALAQHVTSVRNHITALGGKDYHTLIGQASLDFVLVFVPNESALTLALNQAPELFDLAMERNIGLVSPNLLMITLRTIENLWRTERQNQNAMQIARQAGALYDKFVGFVDSLEDVGKRLNQAQDAYEGAHKKLSSGSGNLVGRSDRLKKLGAKTSKSLPTLLVSTASGDLSEPDAECETTATGS